jgi:hypothetical protein
MADAFGESLIERWAKFLDEPLCVSSQLHLKMSQLKIVPSKFCF